MRAAFAGGKSAMYYGGTWEVPSLQEGVKDFTWGVFAFPKMAGTPGEPSTAAAPTTASACPPRSPEKSRRPSTSSNT